MSDGINWADTLTAGVKRAVDILFLINPRGTSVGAVVGVVLHGAAKAFQPLLARFRQVFDLTGIHVAYFIAAGVVVFNISSIFRRRELPKEIEEALEAVRRLERTGKLTKVQAKIQYLAICTQVVSRVQLSEKVTGTSSRGSDREAAAPRP